jgi:ASC-1-like (ASCH) protein
MRVAVLNLPWFLAKKEVFEWLMHGQKTIDVRKGNPKPGEIAVFQSGPRILRLKIVKTESGQLSEVLRSDNFKSVIPSALELGDAVSYLEKIYGDSNGVFTSYYIAPLFGPKNAVDA